MTLVNNIAQIPIWSCTPIFNFSRESNAKDKYMRRVHIFKSSFIWTYLSDSSKKCLEACTTDSSFGLTSL